MIDYGSWISDGCYKWLDMVDCGAEFCANLQLMDDTLRDVPSVSSLKLLYFRISRLSIGEGCTVCNSKNSCNISRYLLDV